MPNESICSILRLVHQTGTITRGEIAEQLGLSFSLSSKLSAELINLGLVTSLGRSTSEGGRPADKLSINPKAGYAVGLEINSAYQRAVLVDLTGEIVSSLMDTQPFPNERDAIVNTLETLCFRIIEQAGVTHAQVLGIGIGLWGMVDPLTGVVGYWTETPGWASMWNGFPLQQALQERLQKPHILVDDIVRMLGLAEYKYGCAENGDDFIYLLADSGIGIAIMIGGRPYTGASHIAGELGHMLLGVGSTACGCGNVGCLETLTSTNAILTRTRQRLGESPFETVLFQFAENFSIEDIIRAAEGGDKLAYQILTEAGEYLGRGLAMAINLLGPQLVAVGGVLSKSTVYLDAAKRMVKLQALNKITNGLRIIRSELGETAGARGAAAYVLDQLFESKDGNILAIREATVNGQGEGGRVYRCFSGR